jgi:hypothetical protein
VTCLSRYGFTVVSLRSESKLGSKMSPRLMSDYRKAAHAVKAWTDVVLVVNDLFAPDDCHGNNSSIQSKNRLMWFCKRPIQLETSFPSCLATFVNSPLKRMSKSGNYNFSSLFSLCELHNEELHG